MNGPRQLPGGSNLVPTAMGKHALEYYDSTPLHSSKPTAAGQRSKKENGNNSGPEIHIRPLDYCSLISGDSHSAELERTAKDLAQWLTVVELGLNGMLDNSIEEESEHDFGDSLSHESLLAIANDRSP